MRHSFLAAAALIGTAAPAIADPLADQVRADMPALMEIYRDLHANPELSMQETRSSALLAAEARKHGAQGVICGHIHHAAMRQVGDVLYINTGDWVESCTAVGETEDGLFEIIRWSPHSARTSRVESPVEELEAAA